MRLMKRKGRFVVAFLALAIAFVLSVQLGEKGVQFDLRQAEVSATERSGEESYQLSSLRIYNRVLLQIKENYVEPERILPGEMLLASLDAVQNEIPEFVVRYSRDQVETGVVPEELEVQVAGARQTFQLGPLESLWEMSLRLKEIFIFVEQNLPEDADREVENIEYAAINGLLTTLDPHSGLLPPRHYEDMQTQTGGQFGGLGIVISIRDGQLTVISPIDGTPASQQGIRAQDQIVRIGDESTVNMNLTDAVNRLRGEPGTDVELWIQRASWPEPRMYTVTRAIIKIDSVDSRPLRDKIGYLRIKNFQANTFSDTRSHLAELRESMGGIQGLILDLRDNPGGLLEQSIRISDLFLNEGTIVSTVGIGNTLRETTEATRPGTEPDYPIIVLVNGGSASASEIVSGALQKNERAIVLGDTTFGKGTVQILYEFPDDSALKLTVAQYLTPGGVSIQNTGIVPDLLTIPVEISEERVNLFLSQSMQREADMFGTLANPSMRQNSEEGTQRHIRYIDEDRPDEDEIVDPNEFREDFEIRLATQLLESAGEVYQRSQLLAVLQGELDEISEREVEKIDVELASLGVDWSAGSSSSEPRYEFEVTSSAEGAVQAGDEVTLTGRFTNRSSEPVYRVKALSQSDNPMLRHREFVFGKVEPGETKEWSIDVQMPQDTKSRHDRILFAVSDDEQEFAGDHHFDLVIEEKASPHYVFSYEVVESDGVLRAGEDVTLRVYLENQGEVVGDEASLFLRNVTGSEVYLDQGRGLVSGLESGASESVDFTFELRRVPESGEVALELDVYDTGYRDFLQREIRIPVAESERSMQSWQGSATVSGPEVMLRVGAHEKADPIARVTQGTSLPVVARSGDWLQVELEERLAWIDASQVDAQEGNSVQFRGVEEMMWFQKPRVSLRPAEMLTSRSTVQLNGTISDSWDIEDYYIIIHRQDGPRRVLTRKINYDRVDANEASLDVQVPLFEGMNRISVVTRNVTGISTSDSIYVFRE